MIANHLTVLPYTSQKREQWNEFVRASSVFFQWQRNYMDYHAERFIENSLIVINHHQQIRAIFPAHQQENSIISHSGLTFGGILLAPDVQSSETISIAQTIVEYYQKQNIKNLIIKCLPTWLQLYHADKEILAWQQIGAKINRIEFCYLLPLTENSSYQYRRKRMIAKAKKANISIEESKDFYPFWQILTENLQSRHQTKPVHTQAEIELLAHRFPDNIKLIVSKKENQIVAGMVFYDYAPLVFHAQYIASNQEGKLYGGLDLLLDYVARKSRTTHRYLSLGVNTLRPSIALNWGLVTWKEGFGTKPFAQYEYEFSF